MFCIFAFLCFQFTFHYELIITLQKLEEIKNKYAFTFHYELIITDVEYCINLKKTIYISL